MNPIPAQPTAPARIEYLKVAEFPCPAECRVQKLTPLTVLLGHQRQRQVTVFDVFAFLAECFELGLRRAWDKRGRDKELASREAKGPVVIEIKYREKPGQPLITLSLGCC